MPFKDFPHGLDPRAEERPAGVTALIEWLKRVLTRNLDKHGPTYSATLVVESTVTIVLLHGLAILLWAGFYRLNCFPSWEIAFYFSASSYSTVGYGDVVIPSTWRLLGPLESVTGVLMCGISISVLFALVTRLLDRDAQSLGGGAGEICRPPLLKDRQTRGDKARPKPNIVAPDWLRQTESILEEMNEGVAIVDVQLRVVDMKRDLLSENEQ